MRYIVGVIGFIMVALVVAIVVGLVVTMIFPPPGRQTVMVGIGLDWRNLPGTVLGILAGIHSYRASVRSGKPKE